VFTTHHQLAIVVTQIHLKPENKNVMKVEEMIVKKALSGQFAKKSSAMEF